MGVLALKKSQCGPNVLNGILCSSSGENCGLNFEQYTLLVFRRKLWSPQFEQYSLLVFRRKLWSPQFEQYSLLVLGRKLWSRRLKQYTLLVIRRLIMLMFNLHV